MWYRKTLVKEIGRHKNRVKSLLYYYGISIPDVHHPLSKYWSKRFTNWLREVRFETSAGKVTLERTIATVEFLRKQLLETTRDIKKLSEEESLSHQVTLLRTGKDNVQVHFFEFKELNPKENYGQVYVWTDNIEDLYQSMLANKVTIHPNGPLAIKPWGQKEFALLDPDNNLLTFGQSI